MKRPVIALALLLVACSPRPDRQPTRGVATMTVFTAARFITGNGELIEPAAMVVAEGRIAWVGDAHDLNPPSGAQRVDFGGQTIMPLLTNLHGHPGYLEGTNLSAANYNRASILKHLALYEFYGVGNILSLGADPGDTAFRIRDDQRNGIVGGARLYTAGRGITAPGSWPIVIAALKDAPYQVTTERETRAAVDELASERVDIVKVWVDDNLGRIPKLGAPLYGAAIDEAHAHHLRVFAHVFALQDARDLVKAGVDGLAHSIRDAEVDDELIAMMKARNVVYIPTLTAHEATFVFADHPQWIGDPALREGYPDLSAALTAEPFIRGFEQNPDLQKFRNQYAIARKNLKALADAGVRIGFGTDTGTANRFYGYNEQRELELMVAAGMTPMQAITAATGTSAAILGLNTSGTLAAGQSADFAVLSANPLEAIANTRRITALYRAGVPIDRAALLRAGK